MVAVQFANVQTFNQYAVLKVTDKQLFCLKTRKKGNICVLCVSHTHPRHCNRKQVFTLHNISNLRTCSFFHKCCTEKPTAPTISCPAIVGENSSLTCTCSTANIGQPAGWLHWSRVSAGSIVQGEYGIVTLDLPPQTLTRDDNGRPLFQCEVDWAAGTYRDVYTANVGCVFLFLSHVTQMNQCQKVLYKIGHLGLKSKQELFGLPFVCENSVSVKPHVLVHEDTAMYMCTVNNDNVCESGVTMDTAFAITVQMSCTQEHI